MKPSYLIAFFSVTALYSQAAISQNQQQDISQNQQQDKPKETKGRVFTSPAPSSVERSERMTGATTGASVTMPGKDAPVTVTREGKKEKLDYDTRDQPAAERDTTIHTVVDPKK